MWSAGGGMHQGPRFRCYEDALRYTEVHRDEATFVIHKPNGEVAGRRHDFLVEKLTRTRRPTRPLSHEYQDYMHHLWSGE
jgi:hypothetical protein